MNVSGRVRLDSWKEIAGYLKTSVRTVQRWEKYEGLPVHRHAHSRQDSLYAYTDEIEEWRSDRSRHGTKAGTPRSTAIASLQAELAKATSVPPAAAFRARQGPFLRRDDELRTLEENRDRPPGPPPSLSIPEPCDLFRAWSIPKLATDLSVSTRTIRRDLEALQLAGFPVYDEIVQGSKFWRVDARAMGGLARTGLTLSELAALYFSRALIECFDGTAFRNDITSAFDKLEAVLSPAMRKFLDRLPRAISAKGEHAKRQGAHTYQITARLLDAILGQRVISMQYHSLEGRREKLYTVHPSRLIHAQGGLYLMALVPAYAEVRTFAVERIRKVSVQESTFEPIAELDTDPFKHSLGVHRGGQTYKVRPRFHPQIAPLVKERTWHATQQFNDRTDGSIVMTLDVTDDYALRNWILGFGRLVRVLAPAQLVRWTEEELDAARQQYGPGGVAVDTDVQPRLPFLLPRLANA